ncbi:hypothetical protein MLD38_020273 [Melastoma candidum]|uniref:Uncharacterized protein n=1 Tax=Melastoma candidum TaxID=119954 RepID=A0ACB9QBW0_9MYRT|nr:hypothetical protein MLD38_020273 [Melastoma candidum]
MAVIIVGAGPAGLAVSNCLSHHGISSIILERDDCCSSLWKKRSYDRLHLHLGKEFCYLPYMPHPSSTPRFMSKDVFIDYVNLYVDRFGIRPRYGRSVVSATYDEGSGEWKVEAENVVTREMEVYVSRFLVVATGENGKAVVPKIDGLESFEGKTVHSSEYKCGKEYRGEDVLVVGCGNSGMEIACDLSNYGAHVSIVIRRPFHVLNKEIVYAGMLLAKHAPRSIVDKVMLQLKWLRYGDLSKYGIHAPKQGPFAIKFGGGRTPVIDVGTIRKIKSGNIKVCPGVSKIKGNTVLFDNGTQKNFDAIVFATGYQSTTNAWLKDHAYLMNEDGMPKTAPPNHWKGENGIYCAGFSKNGLFGISKDALAIAADISATLNVTNANLHSSLRGTSRKKDRQPSMLLSRCIRRNT